LANIIKHAKATKVDLLVFERDDAIVIEVGDNGIGVRKNAQADALGLQSLESRIMKYNGSLNITARAGCGTLLEVMLPATS